MKTSSITDFLLIFSIFSYAFVPRASAANIVYDVSVFSTDNYSVKSGGTITTNGTLGELVASDIVSAAVTISDGTDDIDLDTFSIPNGKVFATATALYLPDDVLYISQCAIGEAGGSAMGFSFLPHGYLGSSTSLVDEIIVYESTQETNRDGDWGPGNLVFASAVPEPSVMGLLAMGAGSFLLRRGRKVGAST